MKKNITTIPMEDDQWQFQVPNVLLLFVLNFDQSDQSKQMDQIQKLELDGTGSFSLF